MDTSKDGKPAEAETIEDAVALPPRDEELSEEQLDQVTGGGNRWQP